jgi:DNA-binding response OmpR family regulator
MLRILLAGSDCRLLATRAAVLSKTGATVTYHNATTTLELLDREAFDLVVLCHSLLSGEVAQIVDKVHQKVPGTKILMVTSNLDQYDIHTNGYVDATSVPEPAHLVACVKDLLHVTSYASPSASRDERSHAHLTLE